MKFEYFYAMTKTGTETEPILLHIYNIKSFYKKVPNSIQKSSIHPLKIWIKKGVQKFQ